MPRPKPKSVSDYIAGFPPVTQRALTRVRTAIGRALPKRGVEEAISYGIATFKLDGRAVIYFAGFKDHYSIYPSTKALEAAFAKELAPYELSGRGTIRFPLTKPVPAGLIGRIAKFKLEEAKARIAGGAKRKS